MTEWTSRGFWGIEQFNIRGRDGRIIHSVGPRRHFFEFGHIRRARRLRTAAITVSSARAAALALLSVMGATPVLGRTGVQCPPNLGGHQLESIDLFDGPPSRMIGVYPGWGGWPLYKWRFPDGVYLVCSYGVPVRQRNFTCQTLSVPAGSGTIGRT